MKISAPSAIYSSQAQALFCAAALGISLFLAHPVAEMGLTDDWSYIYSARVLADTGHVVYNGWSATMLGWQLYLGALFIKLFGFSFTITRASTLLVSLPGTYLLHRVMMRFGLNAWNATFGTLVVVLSPVFLPVVFSFMSDVCAFFALILCIYLCQRAIQAHTDNAALAWLCFATLSNILGGTVRQTTWLGVLVVVPSTAWLMRKRRGALLGGGLLWILGLLGVYFGYHWFLNQPYSIPEESVLRHVDRYVISRFLRGMADTFFSLALFVTPVLIGFVPRIFDLPRRERLHALISVAIGTGFICAVAAIAIHHGQQLTMLVLPWLGTVVTPDGILHFSDMVGREPLVLPLGLRVWLTVVLLVISVCCVTSLLLRPGSDLSRPKPRSENVLTWAQTAGVLLPFFFVYSGLMLPRLTFRMMLDRYLPPLELVLTIFILRYLEERPVRLRGTMIAAWSLRVATLLLFLGFAIAGTHDIFALARARVAAAAELMQSGVPRTAIDGGMEYNGWTQIEAWGYINDPHLVHPTGAFHPYPSVEPCQKGVLLMTPALTRRYVLAFDPSSCFVPSKYPPVPYETWLPPHGLKIYIQRVD